MYKNKKQEGRKKTVTRKIQIRIYDYCVIKLGEEDENRKNVAKREVILLKEQNQKARTNKNITKYTHIHTHFY